MSRPTAARSALSWRVTAWSRPDGGRVEAGSDALRRSGTYEAPGRDRQTQRDEYAERRH